MSVNPLPPDGRDPGDESTSQTEFQVGQIGALRSDPEKTGAVIAVTPSSPENRYSVFHDGNTATYYASQLCPVDTVRETPADTRS